MAFKLTYSTMFNPPDALHKGFDKAVASLKKNLGREYGMIIDGQDVFADEKFDDFSPVNTEWKLAVMQKGNASHAKMAIDAARRAFPKWSRTPWQTRVKLVRKAASLIEKRIFELGAAMALEVGKNRMESLGDVQETADLMYWPAQMMEENNGFIKPMGKDPLTDFDSTNVSVLRPYGVWLIISPFNFPFALTGGPTGAALVAGNTVVIKPASDTAWIVRLYAECLRDAGIPDGVMNFVTGPGSTLGQALVDSPEIDGATFTGSFDVGMKMYRDFANRSYVRPIVLELGGKNPAIVSRNANLEDAATGIYRSAFGLQGQKCSAASRILVEEPVYDELVAKLKAKVDALVIGDPTERATYIGPVINKNSYNDFKNFTEEINGAGGKFLTGGKVKSGGIFDKGYFCEPTLVTDLPFSHRLWQYEMFLPISTIGKVKNLDEAMKIANDVNYGLTAGFYGSQKETAWFFDNIEAGVTYANRPQGATTGAWPGFQPFGGWKGSGASGKNGGGYYYVQLYMHEQIQTLVKPAKAAPAKKKAAKKAVKKVVKKAAKKAGKKKK
ncbi:MAG: 1-pyrroline-5-carboxylate dehydrogenase [Chloroflexi bacterium]|nr:aldehyde dehydrogenase family protein [Chloroflexi bacterium CFX1]MCK6566404.1 aldehyde dehydrogenase family protein [Anaerolineales bacterium]MCQ3951656.1 L-glutamate gamma-semialdehyde dehydrogenase [Chloroflexota bacterium]MDL1920528.1 aldehyde dehydrogenase family protein [Chloroflexi bacterium CFX5]NUQ59879.1 aldehyde dehydrogenase family protein [Anaerolineales bacterium]